MKRLTFLTNTRHITNLGIAPILKAVAKTDLPVIVSLMTEEGEYKVENEIRLTYVDNNNDYIYSRVSMLDIEDLINDRTLLNVLKPEQVEYIDPNTGIKMYFLVEYEKQFDLLGTQTLTYCNHNALSCSTYEQLVWACMGDLRYSS